MMRRQVIWLLGALVLALALSSCDLLLGTQEPPPTDLLPDLPNYNTVEGQQLTGYISTLSGGAALLAGQPELAAAIAAVDGVIGCYQEVGAVRARAYSHRDDPLSAGAVAVANRNALLDPTNLFNCVGGGRMPASPIQPCTASYTREEGDNAFYVVYAGTTGAICHDFCSNLEGCTVH